MHGPLRVNFCMTFFTTLNSKNIIAAPRIVSIEKPEMIFVLISLICWKFLSNFHWKYVNTKKYFLKHSVQLPTMGKEFERGHTSQKNVLIFLLCSIMVSIILHWDFPIQYCLKYTLSPKFLDIVTSTSILVHWSTKETGWGGGGGGESDEGMEIVGCNNSREEEVEITKLTFIFFLELAFHL